MEQDRFNSGLRPACNPGISVSRVGGAALTKAMKKVAGSLRLDLSQYTELQAFAQFGTDDLDDATKQQLVRGERLTELLKQPQYQPLSGVFGYLDDVPSDKVVGFEAAFHEYMGSGHGDLIASITSSGDYDDSEEESLKQAITDFKGTVAY